VYPLLVGVTFAASLASGEGQHDQNQKQGRYRRGCRAGIGRMRRHARSCAVRRCRVTYRSGYGRVCPRCGLPGRPASMPPGQSQFVHAADHHGKRGAGHRQHRPSPVVADHSVEAGQRHRHSAAGGRRPERHLCMVWEAGFRRMNLVTASVSGNAICRACFRIFVLNCCVLSTLVRWCPSPAIAIVTQLVTRSPVSMSSATHASGSSKPVDHP
jgi:hypothetical protein